MTQKKRITIEPITRLEGHGKIDIFINENGSVDKAYFQVPELRGFDVFCLGRPAEDMPHITISICGVCPTAHHMAAARALDDLYEVTPPPTAKKIRELVYNAFQLEDHALHVYVLGGADFIVGPHAAPGMRNILGVVETVGVEVGKRVITMRRRVREFIAALGGKVIHPVLGLPGGISKPMDPSRPSIRSYDPLLALMGPDGKFRRTYRAQRIRGPKGGEGPTETVTTTKKKRVSTKDGTGMS